MQSPKTAPLVAIACGGTGGHLFPGVAVADLLARHGCAVSLIVSSRELDRQAVKSAAEIEVVTLPAVALTRGSLLAFLRGCWHSYRQAARQFKSRRPAAILGMGSFTSGPPLIAGSQAGAATFLHEANSIPGRANRWLAPRVDHVFVGFPEAKNRLRNRNVTVTGTPVRRQFREMDATGCRVALGLDAGRPTLLVVGGSQGASAINNLVAQSLPLLAAEIPALQYVHLTGTNDFEKVCGAYGTQQLKAVVRPFLTEMELALGAATAAISRAGASSLAEFAAMRLPAILVPYPSAADNHQLCNAKALGNSGAAQVLAQSEATPEKLVGLVKDLVAGETTCEAMRAALKQWHRPDAAERIAAQILGVIVKEVVNVAKSPNAEERSPTEHRLRRAADALVHQ